MIRLFLISCLYLSIACPAFATNASNVISKDRMLLVLAAPSISDKSVMGRKYYDDVIKFHIDYAKKIIGHDNVVILVDQDTAPYYRKELPEDVLLLVDESLHIWMRDFTTVNPLNPVQGIYTWATMSKRESRDVQRTFSTLVDKYGIQRFHSKYVIDGGNVVDNYAGKAVVTKRFLRDNSLNYEEGKEILKEMLGASHVAIIDVEYGDYLGHADGVVMWVENDVLLVNDYHRYDQEYRSKLLAELNRSFPETTIVEIPVEYGDDDDSAVGINVNSTVTFNHIYVPVYGMRHEKTVLRVIGKNTNKKVHTIRSNGVATGGGSVRCLTWQLAGQNAEKLILAARKDGN
ncbi:MAG: agmatine deiminase family protein [Gammaproteobacteria bacterium]|nr:agmatine deiminase family protein [Gammaproteobacteria bacterium]